MGTEVMSLNASMLRRLAALKLSADAFQEILSILAEVEGEDENRRSKARSKMARWRNRNRNGDATVTSPLPLQTGNSDQVHIGTSTSREETKESKKERKKTISALFDVPDDASEENRTFAESKGWQRQRIDSEWQRFRDHSINKGKKHRNVAAAWRNWVTSPYQGAQNDDQKSLLASTDWLIDRVGGMEAARAYVPGSSGPTPLRLDSGSIPPSIRRLPPR
jgi:ATP-dependent Clp protease ATP-binding subunit ClpA